MCNPPADYIARALAVAEAAYERSRTADARVDLLDSVDYGTQAERDYAADVALYAEVHLANARRAYRAALALRDEPVPTCEAPLCATGEHDGSDVLGCLLSHLASA